MPQGRTKAWIKALKISVFYLFPHAQIIVLVCVHSSGSLHEDFSVLLFSDTTSF